MGRACQPKVPAEQQGGVGAQALRHVGAASVRLAVLVWRNRADPAISPLFRYISSHLVGPEERRQVRGGHSACGRRHRACRVCEAAQAAAQPRRAVRTAAAASLCGQLPPQFTFKKRPI